MTLAEMADYVTKKIGQTDTDSVAICKTFLNARYKMIWDSANWRDTLSLVSVTTTANSPWLLMPYGMERVQKVRVDTLNTLSPFSAAGVFDFDNSLFDNFGTPAGFLNMAPVVMMGTDLTNGSTINLLANGLAANDIGLTATAEYEDYQGNVYTLEDIALGADAAGFLLAVIAVLRFNKPVTSAYYQLDNGVANRISVFGNETEAKRRPRIKLLQGPSTATACLVLCKRLCPGFGFGVYGTASGTGDNDSPLLRNIDNALLAFAQGDMLERQRQYGKAKVKIEEGAAQLKIALDLELNQSASNIRIIPEDVYGNPTLDGSFGSLGKGYW